MQAVSSDNMPIALELLGRGADVNLRDNVSILLIYYNSCHDGPWVNVVGICTIDE